MPIASRWNCFSTVNHGVSTSGKQERYTATFEVSYEAGTLKAIGYTSGVKAGECNLQTAGATVGIVICHAMDITLLQRLTIHQDEVRPGLGGLDYETPLMLEHLSSEGEYVLAAEHIRGVAAKAGVKL